MRFPRSSGVLLHITSLPGPYGIGQLGEEACRFVDFLEETGQKLWQMLPLNPLGYGSSPYASPSAFAGNALLIDPAKLVRDGFLSPRELPAGEGFDPAGRVDFLKVTGFQKKILSRACEAFRSGRGGSGKEGFEVFCREEASWLDNYALYISLKRRFRGAPWYRWPSGVAFRKPQALKKWRGELSAAIEEAKFVQYLFFRQWKDLRGYANEKGIGIVGDIPIFVSHDSADVWAYRKFYYLDKQGQRTVLSGVPPIGNFDVSQIWGNPLYRWRKMANDGFRWWTERFAVALRLVDIIRVDHFTGFCRTWHVPPGAKTSAEGKWVKGPGAALFRAAEKTLGEFPVIAEDLGPIQKDVDVLLAETGFPGIRVFQFGFDFGEIDVHQPRSYPPRCVGYTGTHDTDTAAGWFRSLPPEKKERVLKYLGTGAERDIHWKIVRSVMESAADTAITPLQDILGLGSEGRMNNPGTESGQWGWRFKSGELTSRPAARLASLTEKTNRK